MSIEALFDHTIIVHRSSANTTGQPVDEFGDVTSDYTPGSSTEPAAVVPPKLTQKNYGAGEQAAGVMEVYMRADAVVDAHDILEVVSGPEAPSTWRVMGKATPRGNHKELVVEPYTGAIA